MKLKNEREKKHLKKKKKIENTDHEKYLVDIVWRNWKPTKNIQKREHKEKAAHKS